jgi:hypothetical protein
LQLRNNQISEVAYPIWLDCPHRLDADPINVVFVFPMKLTRFGLGPHNNHSHREQNADIVDHVHSLLLFA